MKKDSLLPLILIGAAILFWWVTKQLKRPEMRDLFKPNIEIEVGKSKAKPLRVPASNTDIK